MSPAGTKRERLLDWIVNGDPKDVPVLFFPGPEIAASYFGKTDATVTVAEQIEVAERTGTHNVARIGMPMSFDVIGFLNDISMNTRTETLPNGKVQSITAISTPEGTLRQAKRGKWEWSEMYVKSADELPAFASLIRKTSEATVNNPAVREYIDQQMKMTIASAGREFPTLLFCYCPAVELMSAWYMDQVVSIYLLQDHRYLMEELMDCHWKMTQVWLELAAKNGTDFYMYAVNGLEWISMDMYERYMIPQAKLINDFAAANGKLSWIHTCGKLAKLAKIGVYRQMNVSIVESMSAPPTGDIENMAETRAHIGKEITTRGGINVELMYENTPDSAVKRTESLLDSMEGFRHMIGDTNDSEPPYPWENIQAVIDTVKSRGRLFE